MTSRKHRVYASGLGWARASGTTGYQYQLAFRQLTGLAAVQGREVVVTMTGAELATAIAAIPAAALDREGADLRALTRVMTLLRTAGTHAATAAGEE